MGTKLLWLPVLPELWKFVILFKIAQEVRKLVYYELSSKWDWDQSCMPPGAFLGCGSRYSHWYWWLTRGLSIPGSYCGQSIVPTVVGLRVSVILVYSVRVVINVFVLLYARRLL